MFNGMLLDVAALLLGAGRIFIAFIIVDAILSACRMYLIRLMHEQAARDLRTPTGAYLVVAIAWCGLQGVVAFTAMRTAIAPLQVICAMTVIGLVGPICARNYAAPRYALLLVALCLVPLVAGALLSGNLWLCVLVVQSPAFLLGAGSVLDKLLSLSIATLQAEEASRERSLRDPLTGLLNRTGLRASVEHRMPRIERRIVVFFLDLDGFKPVNDDFGHKAGDDVLVAVARRLSETAAHKHLVARHGGDEFVVVAQDMGPSEAEEHARGLIAAISASPYRLEDASHVRIGVSVGFACCPEDGNTLDELERKADFALNRAKAEGKGVHRRCDVHPQPAMSVTEVTRMLEMNGNAVFEPGGCEHRCNHRPREPNQRARFVASRPSPRWLD